MRHEKPRMAAATVLSLVVYLGLAIAGAGGAARSLARIRAEERLLSETFGTEYDAYRARTGRLIPCVY
jgi:protein-S-isoprenylcysteine O-methyltransferase Ste14